MSKAEDLAFERYPDYRAMDGGYITQRNKRMVYVEGYHQAEKDLELTVDDIMKLDALLIEMWNRPSNEDKYQEVLKRFNEERQEKSIHIKQRED